MATSIAWPAPASLACRFPAADVSVGRTLRKAGTREGDPSRGRSTPPNTGIERLQEAGGPELPKSRGGLA
jgi:hypothetical protein